MRAKILFVFVAALLLAVPSAVAEWSSDAAVNLAVGDRTGEQVQPKVRPTSDGGCYISWFDNSAGGYDVYIQRLDANGDEQFAHNGVLVADRSFSSTQDYDLVVDSNDNAILTYRDDRFTGTQIGANKITPAGTLAWGTTGVQLTSTTAFVGSPNAAISSAGSVVIGWSQDSDFALQKLDTDGIPQWGAGVMETAGTGSYILSDLESSDSGAVIALWVRPVGAIFTDKHLYTQKYSSTGTRLWAGGSPVIVYDGGSVQIGYFPTFRSDGSGGGVYGWYEVSGVRNCYVQRVDAAGNEVFPHDGVAASTLGSRIRLSPDVAYDPSTGETFLFWTESNTGQSQFGLYGQKFSAAGARQWTDSAKQVLPLTSSQNSFVRTIPSDGGAVVAYFDQSGSAKVVTAKLDTNGDFVWSGSFVDACSLLSGKSRLDLSKSTSGMALLTWSDGRDDSGDVYAQNVNPDGTLGLPDAPVITTCGVGATNAGCGSAEDVLSLNGSAGGSERTVTVTTTDALTLTIVEPTSRQGDGQTTDCCVYGWLGSPGDGDVVVVPKGLGDMCFGPLIIATKNPKKIWNSLGLVNKLGVDNAPGPQPVIPDLSSFDLLSLPGGFNQAVTVTFQGIVEDDCSQGTVPLSVTNGMVLEIVE